MCPTPMCPTPVCLPPALGKGSQATRESIFLRGGGKEGSRNSQMVSFWHGVGCGNHNYGLHIYHAPDAVLVPVISLHPPHSAKRQGRSAPCYRRAWWLRGVKEHTHDHTAGIQASWAQAQSCLVPNPVLSPPPLLHRTRRVLGFSSL